MPGLVIGIYPVKDGAAIENALTAQQVDVTRVKVLALRGDDSEDPHSLHFIDVVNETDEEVAEGTRWTGVLPDGGGTAVPGLNNPDQWSDIFVHHGGTTENYLSPFPIPDDEVENFDDALAEGRVVVLYPDPGADEAKIAAAFKAAGLLNVRSY